MKNISIIIIIVSVLTGCIETDSVEDEVIILSIVLPEFSDNSESISGLVGDDIALMTKAMNDRGIEFQPEVTWKSSNDAVATVNEDGTVELQSTGSAKISASAFGLTSNEITVFVVNSEDEIAQIILSISSTMLQVEESLIVMAEAQNVRGEQISDVDFSWTSSNPDVATIDQSGNLTTLSEGMSVITAAANDISSSFTVMVGDLVTRAGLFNGLNGYSVSGDVNLIEEENGLMLELGSNFSASNGPELYVYLSNNSNSISGGFEVSELRKNSGSDLYEIDESITIDQFNHVIIYCKPFGLAFGSASLN